MIDHFHAGEIWLIVWAHTRAAVSYFILSLVMTPHKNVKIITKQVMNISDQDVCTKTT